MFKSLALGLVPNLENEKAQDFKDTTETASQRLTRYIKREIPLYHRSGDTPLDPTTLLRNMSSGPRFEALLANIEDLLEVGQAAQKEVATLVESILDQQGTSLIKCLGWYLEPGISIDVFPELLGGLIAPLGPGKFRPAPVAEFTKFAILGSH